MPHPLQPLALVVTFFTLALFGCSSTDKPSVDSCQPFDYANYTPPAAPITFRDHVHPQVFKASCSLSSSCHANGSPHRPHLGPVNGILDAAAEQVILGELSSDSQQVPRRKYVVPGKPEDSYLMNKIDGSNDCAGFNCVGDDGCGKQMPESSPPLERERMNLVRDWIKQGAH